MVNKRQEGASKQLLLLLVVATLAVAIVGTWLVLENGLTQAGAARSGTVSFDKTSEAPAQPVTVIERNAREAASVSFTKR